jgi:hypothetical protein
LGKRRWRSSNARAHVTTSNTAGPGEEAARLAAVRRYEVLDTPEDGAFDRITALAARHFGVPIAIVSIVDHDRIWFKSHHGVEVREVGRDPGLCASAIMHDGPWVVEDAAVIRARWPTRSWPESWDCGSMPASRSRPRTASISAHCA